MNRSLKVQAMSHWRYMRYRSRQGQLAAHVHRWTRLHCLAIITLALLVGCIEGRQSTHELEHTTPAHWPANMLDAADKLEHRIATIDDAAAAQELVEIISWIPEVAADGPLPEQSWNELHISCEKLSAMDIQKSTDRTAYTTAVRQLSQQLRQLHASLPKPIERADDVLADPPTEQ